MASSQATSATVAVPVSLAESMAANMDERWRRALCKDLKLERINQWDIPLPLVEAFPDKPWNWEILSIHDDLTCAFVERLIDRPWNFMNLSVIYNVDTEEKVKQLWALVAKHPEKPWNVWRLSDHTYVDWEFVFAHPDWQWNTYALTQNIPSWAHVMRYLDWPWNWNSLPSAPWFCYSLVEEHPQDVPWDWRGLSEHAPWSFVLDHMDLPWDWHQVTYTAVQSDHASNRDFIVVFHHPECPWDWDVLTHALLRDFYLLDTVKEHAFRILKEHIDKPWNFQILSSNVEALTWAFVEAHADKAWNWKRLSEEHDVLWPFVERHLDKEWDWFRLSRSETLTWAFVEKHPELPWDWGNLLSNKRLWAWRADEKEAYARRFLAARRIQRRWRECVRNPNCVVCRRRLAREFGGLERPWKRSRAT